MRIGGSFDLRVLDQRFVSHAQLRVGGIQGIPREIKLAEHPTVGSIGVVGDGQGLEPRLALLVHPAPKVFGIVRVKTRKGQERGLVTVEDDVPVEILELRARGGVLIPDKGGEAPGIVVTVGRFDNVLPGIGKHLVVHKLHAAIGAHKID